MDVKLYLNEEVIGEGSVLELVEGYKGATGYNVPGKIKIEMKTKLSSKLANSINVDNNITYKIKLDIVRDFNVGSVITGKISNKQE